MGPNGTLLWGIAHEYGDHAGFWWSSEGQKALHTPGQGGSLVALSEHSDDALTALQELFSFVGAYACHFRWLASGALLVHRRFLRTHPWRGWPSYDGPLAIDELSVRCISWLGAAFKSLLSSCVKPSHARHACLLLLSPSAWSPYFHKSFCEHTEYSGHGADIHSVSHGCSAGLQSSCSWPSNATGTRFSRKRFKRLQNILSASAACSRTVVAVLVASRVASQLFSLFFPSCYGPGDAVEARRNSPAFERTPPCGEATPLLRPAVPEAQRRACCSMCKCLLINEPMPRRKALPLADAPAGGLAGGPVSLTANGRFRADGRSAFLLSERSTDHLRGFLCCCDRPAFRRRLAAEGIYPDKPRSLLEQRFSSARPGGSNRQQLDNCLWLLAAILAPAGNHARSLLFIARLCFLEAKATEKRKFAAPPAPLRKCTRRGSACEPVAYKALLREAANGATLRNAYEVAEAHWPDGAREAVRDASLYGANVRRAGRLHTGGHAASARRGAGWRQRHFNALRQGFRQAKAIEQGTLALLARLPVESVLSNLAPIPEPRARDSWLSGPSDPAPDRRQDVPSQPLETPEVAAKSALAQRPAPQEKSCAECEAAKPDGEARSAATEGAQDSVTGQGHAKLNAHAHMRYGFRDEVDRVVPTAAFEDRGSKTLRVEAHGEIAGLTYLCCLIQHALIQLNALISAISALLSTSPWLAATRVNSRRRRDRTRAHECGARRLFVKLRKFLTCLLFRSLLHALRAHRRAPLHCTFAAGPPLARSLLSSPLAAPPDAALVDPWSGSGASGMPFLQAAAANATRVLAASVLPASGRPVDAAKSARDPGSAWHLERRLAAVLQSLAEMHAPGQELQMIFLQALPALVLGAEVGKELLTHHWPWGLLDTEFALLALLVLAEPKPIQVLSAWQARVSEADIVLRTLAALRSATRPRVFLRKAPDLDWASAFRRPCSAGFSSSSSLSPASALRFPPVTTGASPGHSQLSFPPLVLSLGSTDRDFGSAARRLRPAEESKYPTASDGSVEETSKQLSRGRGASAMALTHSVSSRGHVDCGDATPEGPAFLTLPRMRRHLHARKQGRTKRPGAAACVSPSLVLERPFSAATQEAAWTASRAAFPASDRKETQAPCDRARAWRIRRLIQLAVSAAPLLAVSSGDSSPLRREGGAREPSRASLLARIGARSAHPACCTVAAMLTQILLQRFQSFAGAPDGLSFSRGDEKRLEGDGQFDPAADCGACVMRGGTRQASDRRIERDAGETAAAPGRRAARETGQSGATGRLSGHVKGDAGNAGAFRDGREAGERPAELPCLFRLLCRAERTDAAEWDEASMPEAAGCEGGGGSVRQQASADEDESSDGTTATERGASASEGDFGPPEEIRGTIATASVSGASRGASRRFCGGRRHPSQTRPAHLRCAPRGATDRLRGQRDWRRPPSWRVPASRLEFVETLIAALLLLPWAPVQSTSGHPPDGFFSPAGSSSDGSSPGAISASASLGVCFPSSFSMETFSSPPRRSSSSALRYAACCSQSPASVAPSSQAVAAASSSAAASSFAALSPVMHFASCCRPQHAQAAAIASPRFPLSRRPQGAEASANATTKRARKGADDAAETAESAGQERPPAERERCLRCGKDAGAAGEALPAKRESDARETADKPTKETSKRGPAEAEVKRGTATADARGEKRQAADGEFMAPHAESRVSEEDATTSFHPWALLELFCEKNSLWRGRRRARGPLLDESLIQAAPFFAFLLLETDVLALEEALTDATPAKKRSVFSSPSSYSSFLSSSSASAAALSGVSLPCSALRFSAPASGLGEGQPNEAPTGASARGRLTRLLRLSLLLCASVARTLCVAGTLHLLLLPLSVRQALRLLRLVQASSAGSAAALVTLPPPSASRQGAAATQAGRAVHDEGLHIARDDIQRWSRRGRSEAESQNSNRRGRSLARGQRRAGTREQASGDTRAAAEAYAAAEHLRLQSSADRPAHLTPERPSSCGASLHEAALEALLSCDSLHAKLRREAGVFSLVSFDEGPPHFTQVSSSQSPSPASSRASSSLSSSLSFSSPSVDLARRGASSRPVSSPRSFVLPSPSPSSSELFASEQAQAFPPPHAQRKSGRDNEGDAATATLVRKQKRDLARLLVCFRGRLEAVVAAERGAEPTGEGEEEGEENLGEIEKENGEREGARHARIGDAAAASSCLTSSLKKGELKKASRREIRTQAADGTHEKGASTENPQREAEKQSVNELRGEEHL
ncbi:hypothetical protein BESB_052310 [Besnoitia besnoiti]|uniref:Uncharacterized protein n=1 Tax=Besnoitia besnoiti TaxID=94643 RepID=A0A2A9MJK4_BESBE|nr:hypothetical protein BESB_052310 [Besnoitia besnoiti]PFH35580.1 hypothetical protein BESB_052310 [Besnoitia besnoiti]